MANLLRYLQRTLNLSKRGLYFLLYSRDKKKISKLINYSSRKITNLSDKQTPYSLVALVGLPRSGTTLTHRVLCSHSLVDGIIEPYQSKRNANYCETNIFNLCADFSVKPSTDKAILVKETATREINIQHTLDLLENTRIAGIYTALIVLFRSPFEAYLSHVEASENWQKSEKLAINNQTFTGFANNTLQSLEHIVRRVRAQHYRLVSYRTFCSNPECETARLMAVFPLRFEQQQLIINPATPKGGDPKAYTSNLVSYSDRSDEVDNLFATLNNTPILRQMNAYDEFCSNFESMPQQDAMDWLTEIVMMRKA